jgi:heterodisulfide reductase subunit A
MPEMKEETKQALSKVGVFICRWGINIASVIDCKDLVDYSKHIEGVECADDYLSYCTEGGARNIKAAIDKNKLDRVVLAAWTPKTHQPVFQAVLKEAGINERMLEFVNIREHDAFIHVHDKQAASLKAHQLIRAAVARAQQLEAVPTEVVEINPTVLVVGGGVAGLSAAIDLANQPKVKQVVVVERKNTIGGRMAQMDRTFPTDDCSIWILGPKMLDLNRQKKVKVHTLAEVDQVTGYIGNFNLRVKQYPRYIDEKKCTGCGLCAKVCPVVIPNPFDESFSARKVADRSFAQAVPMTFDIDINSCIHCYECVAACDQFAIDFSQRENFIDYKVGSIILATGWDLYKPKNGKYGYGKYPNVIDQIELERILAPNGPTLGHIVRPSDHKTPQRVVMIQCVGSRGDVNEHCSQVCCSLAAKNAKLIKSELPGTEVIISYIDMRCAGKDYEEYYKRSREAGVIFIGGKVAKVSEDPSTRNIIVTMEDKNSGEILEVDADLVVLSSATMASVGTTQVAKVLKMEQSPEGFLKEFHSRLNPISTKVPGIFIAGSCQGPKSIGSSVSQAKGAASAASLLVNNENYEIELIRAVVEKQETCSRCYRCVDACPYHAISFDKNGNINVDIVACHGCGTCTNVCRSQTIQLRYYRDGQYEAYIDAMFDETLATTK